MIEKILKQIGFDDNEVKIYIKLLEKSPTSVRSLAEDSGIGRGTVFNILKKFISEGIASYYHKGKGKFFAAEDPAILKNFLKKKKDAILNQQKAVEKIIPELKSVYSSYSRKPIVKYFEGSKEASDMLCDVLNAVSKEKNKEYYVYSTKGKRQIIYEDFPDFSKQRIKAGIKVKAIAIGGGGELRGLDERKWLSKKEPVNSSYMVIYASKISFVTLDKQGTPVGVIIEDRASAETQKMIFKRLWQAL